MSIEISITRFVACVVAATGCALAQSSAPSGGMELSVEYSFTAAGDAEFAGATQGEVELNAYRFAATYQRPVSETFTLAGGVNYEQLEFDTTAGVPLPETLRGVSLSMSGRWAVDSNWLVVAIAEPGVYTDTEASSSDGLAAQGILLVQRRLSSTLTAGAGLRVSSLGDNSILPFPMVSWQPSPAWTVLVGAPRTEVAFAFDAATTYFTGASFLGGAFAVDDPEITAPPGHAGLRDTELDVREIRVGIGVRRTFGSVRVEIEGGAAVDRTYDYYHRDLEIEADPAGFFRLSLVAQF